MRQPEYGTNKPYLIDSIHLCLSPKYIKNEEIRKLYLNQGLSTNQIASHFGVSRTVITSRLHELGISGNTASSRSTRADNYLSRVPPYGYSVKNSCLVPNKTELKVCRLVVELADRQNRPHTEVARELGRRGFKNRAGHTEWNSKTVFNILKRWRGKI